MTLLLGASVLVLLVGCSSTPAAPASPSPEPVPTLPIVVPSVGPGGFSGSARVIVELQGITYELDGGQCDILEYPPGSGEWAYAVNVGTPGRADGGPDYFGLVVGIEDPAAPDGTYYELIIAGSFEGRLFNIGAAELTISSGGREGSFTGTSEGTPARGAFSCEAAATGGQLTLPPFPDETPTPTDVDSGVRMRIVNAWAEQGGYGPRVVACSPCSPNEPPLLEVGPGQVSEFVTLPLGASGDQPALIEILPADAPAGSQAVMFGGARRGDRVTVIVYGRADSAGAIAIAATPIWEHGLPTTGVAWPDVPSGRAVLRSLWEPLMTLPVERRHVEIQGAGTCLEEVPASDFLLLPVGTTHLNVGTAAIAGCGAIEPDIGEIDVTASTGQRLTLVTLFHDNFFYELLLLDMGTTQ